SIHDEDVPVFRLLRMRARRSPGLIADAKDVLLKLFNFLMDATVGFININQNKVIKIFSVASVALLPPTLVASVYGMNLKFPELLFLGDWSYPYTVALMVFSAALPMWYFGKRGWLK
ncbi:MAG: hypothetical protein EBR18_06825, partial [Betaproteobacteria bacterium]|nr:hypothetical protein [Betaproteobacteria bacterium]